MTTERMKLAEAALERIIAQSTSRCTSDIEMRQTAERALAALRAPEADAGAVAWEYETEMGDHGYVKVYGPIKPDTRDYRCRNARALVYATPTAAGIAAPAAASVDAVREATKALAEMEAWAKDLWANARRTKRWSDDGLKQDAAQHILGAVERWIPKLRAALTALTAPVAGADAGMRERAAATLTAKQAMDIGIKIAEDHAKCTEEMLTVAPGTSTERLLHGSKAWLASKIMRALQDAQDALSPDATRS
jgi:hypothetical protein